MKTTSTIALLSLGALALAPAAPSSAMAQPPAVAGFVGSAASSVQGCPALVWRLARRGDDINGIAYYADLSGLSFVHGTINQAGQFKLELTSAMGSGPIATVTGRRAPKGQNDSEGALVADMTGQGCANMQLHIPPVENLNVYSYAGG